MDYNITKNKDIVLSLMQSLYNKSKIKNTIFLKSIIDICMCIIDQQSNFYFIKLKIYHSFILIKEENQIIILNNL